MILESTTTERKSIEQFLETLRALPEVQAKLDHAEPADLIGHRSHDAQIDLRIAGRSFIVLIEVKKSVYPRDVREVLWKFRAVSHKSPTSQSNDKVVSVLVAESISPGAKELLRNEHIGYYDSGGSLFLPAHGVYLYIDKPPPKTLSKSLRSLFSGRRAQVLHTLLMRHQEWFGGKELAQQALVSPATASQVLTELDRFDWLISRGKGPSKERHLQEPAALLDAWVKQIGFIAAPALRRYYVPCTKADTLLEHIAAVFASHEVGYAISFEAAAQRYAPFLSNVSQVRTRLLVGASGDIALGALGARVVSEGANLVIIDAKSPGELLLREQVGGIWLASPIQVYLDLLRGEGRAKEMAEHLRKERIGF